VIRKGPWRLRQAEPTEQGSPSPPCPQPSKATRRPPRGHPATPGASWSRAGRAVAGWTCSPTRTHEFDVDWAFMKEKYDARSLTGKLTELLDALPSHGG
jgi:hypothetical protein